jgi:AraC family transcriptional regulator, regulatory protein of adaptative response / DNA-3-methyladenine glycosylase II
MRWPRGWALASGSLRRLFRQHLGASPIAVAQTRRVLFAKQLIVETTMPMTEVALASGFSSIRRFNATFHTLYRRPPRELRRSSSAVGEQTGAEGITLMLALCTTLRLGCDDRLPRGKGNYRHRSG